jgi:glycosyltransferase involved in cell wall biosynthesis
MEYLKVKSRIKFSVIIPVYNAEKYLEFCISSIQKQTYTNFEILLIEDGSTDKSAQLCDELAEKDERIKAIHQSNQGAALSRNLGISLATGEYILFPDSDDYYLNTTGLEVIARQLKESESEIIFFDRVEITEEKKIMIESKKGILRDQIFNQDKETALTYIIQKNILYRAAWSKVIKKTLLEKYKICFPEVRQTEDVGFTASLIFYAQTFDWLSEPFYAYVQHEGSITAKRVTSKTIKEAFSVIKKSLDLVKGDKGLSKLYLSYLAYPYAVLLGQLQEAKERGLLIPSSLEKELKNSKFLLKYNLNPQMKIISLFYKIFGYALTSKVLGWQMNRIYKRKGF